MAEKRIARSHDTRKIQLLVDAHRWKHDAKSELKKLLMSQVKEEATDEQIMAVAHAILTLIGSESEAQLDSVRDIQQFSLAEVNN